MLMLLMTKSQMFEQIEVCICFPPLTETFIHFSPVCLQYLTISSLFWQSATLTSKSLKISDLQQPCLSPCYGHAYRTWLEE